MKNILTILILLLTGLIFTSQVIAQTLSWRDHAKLGEEAENTGRFEEAADHFKSVWTTKNKKIEYLYRAAQNYYLVNDFKNAASCYIHLKDDVDSYPMAGLYYANSLKQYGNYEQAQKSYSEFIDSYTGIDKAEISTMVERNIRGCIMAEEMMAAGKMSYNIQHMPEAINSPKSEFCPIPVGESIVYFSSTRKGSTAKIYFSQFINDAWTNAAKPTKLPRIDGEHYGNGTFTPDFDRFYFTICGSTMIDDELRSRCEIFVIEQKGEEWTSPVKLRDYINDANATTTHPNVVHSGSKEILYFSSNREGSYGGMDIWYCVRSLDSDDYDFTFPKNCGSRINTEGDEITPFYNMEDGNLYFSSNGQIGIGGQDIFKSYGSEAFWDKAEHLGIPLNSSLDDYGFILKPDAREGYLVSNRTYNDSKISTTDEDIFSFIRTDVPEELFVLGRIMEENSMNLVQSADVSIQGISDGDNHELTASVSDDNGFYKMMVRPNKEYQIIVNKTGYSTAMVNFNTFGNNQTENVELDVYMEPSTEVVVTEPIVEETNPIIVEDIDGEEVFEATTDKPDEMADNTAYTEEVAESEINETQEVPVVQEPEIIRMSNDDMASKGKYHDNDLSSNENPNQMYNIIKMSNTSNQVVTYQKTLGEFEAEVNTNVDQMYDNRVIYKTNNNAMMAMASETESYKTSYWPYYTVKSESPQFEGTYYKVQFIALAKNHHALFMDVEHIGDVQKEYIIDRGIMRYMVSSYFNLDDAYLALNNIRSGGYPTAFLVQYENGKRVKDLFNQ